MERTCPDPETFDSIRATAPWYFTLPLPEIFASNSSCTRTVAFPEPLILTSQRLEVSASASILPDPLIVIESCSTEPPNLILPEPLIYE